MRFSGPAAAAVPIVAVRWIEQAIKAATVKINFFMGVPLCELKGKL
jgi:hypothetical protein